MFPSAGLFSRRIAIRFRCFRSLRNFYFYCQINLLQNTGDGNWPHALRVSKQVYEVT